MKKDMARIPADAANTRCSPRNASRCVGVLNELDKFNAVNVFNGKAQNVTKAREVARAIHLPRWPGRGTS